MSGGKRFKFTGSEIGVLVGFGVTKAITGISNANPAVVDSVAHGLADGAVVKLAAIVGMTELNGEVFVIANAYADSFELVDVDSSGYGDYTSGGTAAPATFSNFCELTDYNRAGGSSPEIDAGSLCSTAAEFEIGLPDFGTTQISYNFAPRTAIQMAIEAQYRSGEKTAVKVKLPKDGGEMIQLGFVQQTSEQAAKGGLWAGSMTIRNTGPRIDLAP